MSKPTQPFCCYYVSKSSYWSPSWLIKLIELKVTNFASNLCFLRFWVFDRTIFRTWVRCSYIETSIISFAWKEQFFLSQSTESIEIYTTRQIQELPQFKWGYYAICTSQCNRRGTSYNSLSNRASSFSTFKLFKVLSEYWSWVLNWYNLNDSFKQTFFWLWNS